MVGKSADAPQRPSPTVARKAFNREHQDIWQALAGKAEKIAQARNIQDRADQLRDKLYDHYGKHKDRWIKHEMARLADANFRPQPALRPKWAVLTWEGFKKEATMLVATRHRSRFRKVNLIERRSLERLVHNQSPEVKLAKSRSVRMADRDAKVLDTVDRARTLREKARLHFAKTRLTRFWNATARGAENPKAEIGRQEALRMRRIDKAERNIISQTIPAKRFNRAAQLRSGPSIAM